MKTTEKNLLRRTRIAVAIIIFGLFISGVTAFPLETELRWISDHDNWMPLPMQQWLQTIYTTLAYVNHRYPYLSYGTHWLAFAHLVLAVLFIGPYRNPVKNEWVIQFGIIASLSILPLAFIAGPIRHIPLFWQLIDCSFGVLCLIPLGVALRNIRKLKILSTNN